MCIFLADAGIGQRAKQAAGCAADRHAAQQRRKPSGAHDGADAWKSQHGDETGSGRRRRADRAPDRRALKFAAGRSIAARALLPQRNHIAGVPGPAPSVGIIRDEAGFRRRYARGFEPDDDPVRVGI